MKQYGAESTSPNLDRVTPGKHNLQEEFISEESNNSFIDCRQTSQSKVRHQPSTKGFPSPLSPTHADITHSILPGQASRHSIEHDRFIEEVEVRARQTMAGLREFGRPSCSDTDAGLAPMPPLRVVPIPITLINAPLHRCARE
jgi:hypothetical protein